MSWDCKTRSSGLRYYYRSIRDGDRVRKVYVGRGAKAHEAARRTDERCQARQATRESLRMEAEKSALAEQRLSDLHDMAAQLFKAVLLASGCHEHRGQWRRRKYA